MEGRTYHIATFNFILSKKKNDKLNKKKKIKSSVDWTFIVTSREEDKVHLMELAFVHFTAMTINQ